MGKRKNDETANNTPLDRRERTECATTRGVCENGLAALPLPHRHHRRRRRLRASRSFGPAAVADNARATVHTHSLDRVRARARSDDDGRRCPAEARAHAPSDRCVPPRRDGYTHTAADQCGVVAKRLLHRKYYSVEKTTRFFFFFYEK